MVVAVLGGVAASCGLLVPLEDGKSCERNDQCESERCVGGICVGTRCGGPNECPSGFTCPDTNDGIIFDWGHGGVCTPTCDVCPYEDDERWSCEAPGPETCSYDGTPTIDVGGPYVTQVGEPVTITAIVETAPGREIERLEWTDNTGIVGTSRTVELTFEEPGDPVVGLVVVDDLDGYASTSVTVNVCSPLGGPCGYSSHCCGATDECRDDDADGVANCEPPPVCGDGVIEYPEVCEPGMPVAEDCTDYGDYHPAPVGCTQCMLDPSTCARCGTSFDACSDDSDCCDGYRCNTGTFVCNFA